MSGGGSDRDASRSGPRLDRITPDTPAARLAGPFVRFARLEASSGILLLVCAFVALLWANSPWADSYHDVWHMKMSFGLGGFYITNSLLHWINDLLMVVFFFLVGLEIKREVLVGELSSPRQAFLPIAAAIGGMAFPALIYTAINWGRPGVEGWGVPMATDIAFTLGVLALLGSRAPIALKVFVAAFAIVDDIGAVLVIAIFYTPHVSWGYLGIAGAFYLGAILLNRLGVKSPLAYAMVGAGVWLAFTKSGVHSTIAGILMAMVIPSRVYIDADEFAEIGGSLVRDFKEGGSGRRVLLSARRQATLKAMEVACGSVGMPIQRMEHSLQPWVAFGIVPLFALANAGVHLAGGVSMDTLPTALGVGLGLVIGNPIGITSVSWLAVKLRIAELPTGLTWRHVFAVGCLAGIGFTMSLFVAGLAFGEGESLIAAKIGILAGSLVAGCIGSLMLRSCRVTSGCG